MLRHYPWNERECFIASGSSFFPAARTLELAESLAEGPTYRAIATSSRTGFLGSSIEQTTNKDEVQLRVWEPPEAKRNVRHRRRSVGGGGGDAQRSRVGGFSMLCRSASASRRVPIEQAADLSVRLGSLRTCAEPTRTTWRTSKFGRRGRGACPRSATFGQLAQRGIIQAETTPTASSTWSGAVRWFLLQARRHNGGRGQRHQLENQSGQQAGDLFRAARQPHAAHDRDCGRSGWSRSCKRSSRTRAG